MTLRALGGGELEGDTLVRLVYMDEAGISNPAHEPYLVVVGIIVHADNQLNATRRRLNEIRDKHIPEEVRNDYIFHASEIFNGGKTLNRADWPLDRRLAIADDLAKIPCEMDLKVTFGVLNRSEFPATFELPEITARAYRTVGEHVVAFSACSVVINRWMQENTEDENCLLVVEDNQESRRAIKQMHNYYQSGSPSGDKLFHFTKIQEDPLFQPKKSGSVLELADFCAYIIKRYCMDNDDKRYLRFLDPMIPCIVSFEDD